MAKSDVMVDSNVYIDLLRSKQDALRVLHRWAGDRNLAICGMIRLEVLRGVKSLELLSKLSGYMDVMCNVPATSRIWSEATDLGWKLDRRGITIPGPDLVIAASALRLDSTLMTSDAHFSRIDGLRVIAPPPEWFA